MIKEKERYKEIIEKKEFLDEKEFWGKKFYLLNKTAYSFHYLYQDERTESIYEVFYDLRNKEYFIKSNGREVKFGVSNLDKVLPSGVKTFSGIVKIDEFFDFLSVPENQGMYEQMTLSIGRMYSERVTKPSRALYRLITKLNKLELVYKSGLPIPDVMVSSFHRMLEEANDNNITKLHKIFKVTKAQMKFLLEMHRESPILGHQLVETVAHLRAVSQHDMDMYRGLLNHVKELDQKYHTYTQYDEFVNGTGSVRNFIDAVFRRDNKDRIRYWNKDFFNVFFETGLKDVKRFAEYIVFQCPVRQGVEMINAGKIYYDYYVMLKEYYREADNRGWRYVEKYPKYLKPAHDIISRNLKKVRAYTESQEFLEAIEEKKHLAYKGTDYCIVVPNSVDDILQESNVLGHCVHSYVSRVAKRKTFIVFLRSASSPDRPLVTVEVMGDRITQAKGFENRQVTTSERAALGKYAETKNLHLEAHL